MEKTKSKRQLGKAGRHCAVNNCSNGDYELGKWAKIRCPDHDCLYGNEDGCHCNPPFCLFNFPTRMKKPLDRQKWIQLINRSSGGNKLWSPKKCSRVCSSHFVDGMPTEENPYPTENLGYDAKRKVEHITCSSVQQRRRKVKARHTVSTPTPTPPSSSIIADIDHDHSYISSICSDESINIENLNISSGKEDVDVDVIKNKDPFSYGFVVFEMLLLFISYIYTGQVVSLASLFKTTCLKKIEYINGCNFTCTS